MKKLLLLLLISLSVYLHSCKPDEPEKPTKEEELITTIELKFYNADSSLYQTYYFRDLDGEGGNGPSQWDTIYLIQGQSYWVDLRFLNESGGIANAEDITEEIREEMSEHLVCFNPVPSGLTVTYEDTDGNFPIGLRSKWTVSGVLNGEIPVVLKHQPDGQKNGSCEPGDTDVEVKFQVRNVM